MNGDMDALVDVLLIGAELEDGYDPARMAARSSRAVLAGMQQRSVKQPNRAWTPDEDEFMREHHHRMTDGEMGQALGRSGHAVHIRMMRVLRLPRPTKDTRFITTQKIGETLGVDSHKAVTWFEKGYFRDGEVVPSDCGHVIRRVLRQVFVRWALNPLNWVWFDIEKVPDPRLRRLLLMRKARWGDEWWDTSQAAAYHGVNRKTVLMAIYAGRLKAVQAGNKGGRNARHAWGYWYVLRSEAIKPLFVMGHFTFISEAGDAYLLLARAVGVANMATAANMGWPLKRLEYRLRSLLASGQAKVLVKEYGLNVMFLNGQMWADWREYRQRFPGLVRAIGSFLDGRRMRRDDLLAVRNVLSRWSEAYAVTSEQQAFVKRVVRGRVSQASLWAHYQTLLGWGIDPLGGSGE